MTGQPHRRDALRYCGRQFTPAELQLIGRLAAALPTRRAIADAVCDALGWRRPDGRRKDMSARVALLRMHHDGLIVLPRRATATATAGTPATATPTRNSPRPPAPRRSPAPSPTSARCG